MVKRKIIREIKNEKFKEIKPEEKEDEENIEETLGEEEFGDFTDFIQTSQGRITPVLESSTVQFSEQDMETTVANTPASAPTQTEEETGYEIAAGKYESGYEGAIREEKQERRVRDVQRDITEAKMLAEPTATPTIARREIDFRAWQRTEGGMAEMHQQRDMQEDYMAKKLNKKKTKETKLPFEE